MARRQPEPARGYGPQIVAIGIIVVLAASAIGLYLISDAGEEPPPELPEAPVENPFEGLPPEER